jgi:U3 small nucleolar RNA-associated protein 10
MMQALLHLQQLNPTSAAAAASPSGKTARKQQKAIRAAAAGVYELLSALEAVQDCGSYLRALVQMSRHAAGTVQRRALKLLASRLLKAAVDLADLEVATAKLSAAEKQAAIQQLAAAGLEVCKELPRLLAADAPLTRQLALIAADAGVRQFGQLLPGAVLSCLGAVVGAIGDAAAPVRVSALACVASGVAAVGPKLVPLLPQTAATVLAAAQAACKDLEGFNHQQQQQGSGSDSEDASEDEPNTQQQQQQQKGDADADEDDEEAAASASSKGEEAALQLAGCLAALEALVSGLGAFMSPYLKQLLQLLLHQQVLACSTAGSADAAARLRVALPASIPPRLLLEPLAFQWDHAVAQSSSSSSDDANAAGSSAAAAAAVALLELVRQLCSAIEPSVAMTYHEQLLALLLRALDTRHKWLAAATGQQQQQRAAGAADSPDAAAAAAAIASFGHSEVHAVEAAAVAALAALVMKLSESKFKPLFLRIVDWANVGSSSSTAGDASCSIAQSQGRAAAFLAAVCTLSHRLRSVFAPYYRYFSTLLMKHLAGEPLWGAAGGGSREKRPKKKHRKSAAAAAAAAAGEPGQEGLLLSGWLARLRAVRAVHLLALHDPAGSSPAAAQEQQERFDRLLPLVVEVLADGPPASIAAVVAAQGADSVLDLPGGAVAALGAAGKAAVDAGGAAALQEHCDAVGCAAVSALLQMATAGGSDVYWKPLHHAVLMATRGGGVRAKVLGLGAVSRLAELLREEYLMLLPEALPFVAELIEDGEVAVEGAAQGLVAQLEALSGERLEQYLKA